MVSFIGGGNSNSQRWVDVNPATKRSQPRWPQKYYIVNSTSIGSYVQNKYSERLAVTCDRSGYFLHETRYKYMISDSTEPYRSRHVRHRYATKEFIKFNSVNGYMIMQRKYEDTKGVVRIRKSKKNRQHNGQKKKNKRTNNHLQQLNRTLKIEQHELQ